MKNIILFLLLILICKNKLRAQYLVSTYSGNGTASLVNGPVDSARYNNPFGMCMDINGIIYVADAGNNRIRKIDPVTGVVSTLAGTGIAAFKDGPSDSAMFNQPSDLCVDDSGNVFVSDFMNQRIRKISYNGLVSTVAGTGVAGLINGSHTTARFNYPRGICVDAIGNIYVSDSWNHRIRKIDTAGMVSTYAGGGNAAGVSSVGALVDAQDTAARFYTPAGLAIDKNGNLFVADAYNHRIRLVDTSRYVTTLAGSGQTGPGNGGYMNGPLNMSVFNTPTELFIDTAGNNLYISDTFNNRIRLADLSAASVSTLAGNGNTGFADGIDTMASFNFPRGIVVATTAISKFYVADYNNHSIRLISPDSTSSVSEIEFTALIYPNPTHGFITLSAEKLIRRISIYNINGRVVLSPQIYFYNTTIDLSALSKGVYWLEATDETDKKIIKRFLLF